MSLVALAGSPSPASQPTSAHPRLVLVRHALRRCEITRRHRRWSGRQRVLAAIAMAALVAMVVGPHCMCTFCSSRVNTTLIVMQEYVAEAYPAWRATQPHRACPDSLRDLDPYMYAANRRDAWGTPFDLRCDAAARNANERLQIISAGEDRVFGTEDDLEVTAAGHAAW